MEKRMKDQLDKRKREGSLRVPLPKSELQNSSDSPSDFSSNDYLGLSRDSQQKELVEQSYNRWEQPTLGATGSRLLSGDSLLCRELEDWLATVHNRPAATIFNSGYDANISILSSILLPDDVVLLDELCHNSLIMGIQMSRGKIYKTFRHNDVGDLRQHLQLTECKGRVLIVVESVYSMDGDIAPLKEILDLSNEFGSEVVVDEAHGLGSFGRTNTTNLSLKTTNTPERSMKTSHFFGGTGVLAALELESHPSLLCSIFTFGKAAGCHGAVVCGSFTLREYLWNYARPFVYSTALPTHSLISIQSSYESMIGASGNFRRKVLFANVKLFRSTILQALTPNSEISLWPSPSPIQALVVPGNDVCVEFCRHLHQNYGIRLFPIRAPTVPKGEERVRIILHAHNTTGEVLRLTNALVLTLRDIGLLVGSPTSRSKL
jgi:8-amino-7-oxononanoate synthase